MNAMKKKERSLDLNVFLGLNLQTKMGNSLNKRKKLIM
jgi:hypothetical protein